MKLSVVPNARAISYYDGQTLSGYGDAYDKNNSQNMWFQVFSNTTINLVTLTPDVLVAFPLLSPTPLKQYQ